MSISEEFGGQPRAIERFGGLEAVGSTLWLEHVAGIRFGNDIFITPEDLASDETQQSVDRLRLLRKARNEELLVHEKAFWLRALALHILPLRISGNPEMPPAVLEIDDFKVFRVPKELARSPTVISEGHQAISDFAEIFGIEVDLETEPEADYEETRPSIHADDYAITMSLRLVPSQGEITGIGYYPAHDGIDYGMYAMEMNDEVVRMQLHHRIYFELYRRKPVHELPPIIAPHQF